MNTFLMLQQYGNKHFAQPEIERNIKNDYFSWEINSPESGPFDNLEVGFSDVEIKVLADEISDKLMIIVKEQLEK